MRASLQPIPSVLGGFRAWHGALALAGVISVVAPRSASASYQTAVLADNPVGYWRLDDAPGATTAVNLGSAGALLNGTYPAGGKPSTAGLIASDPSNTAVDLNGSAITGAGMDSVVGGNPFAGNWSIEGWVDRDTTQQWGGVFSNVEGNNGSPLLDFIDNSDSIGINGAGITPKNVSVALGGNHFNEKIYVVVTKSGGNADSTANIDVWVNLGGTLMHSTGTNTEWNLTTSNGWSIGRHYAGGLYLDGQIDEVAIYNTKLSQAQVEAHYAAAVPEPTALAALGCASLLFVRRRRRRTA